MAVRINDDSLAVEINGLTPDRAECQGERGRVDSGPGS